MVLGDASYPDGAGRNKYKELHPLSGKIALVTGSSRGIGKAIALELARRGAMPIIHFHTKERRARETANEISQLGSMQLIPPWFGADITNAEQVESLYSQIQNHPLSGGVIDFLILNAAGGLEREKDPSYAEIINVWAQVNLVRQALRRNLIRTGGNVMYITSHVARVSEEGIELTTPDPELNRFLQLYQPVAHSKHRGEGELLAMEAELKERGINLSIATAPLVDRSPAVLYLKREALLEKAAAAFGLVQPEVVAVAISDFLTNINSTNDNLVIVDRVSYNKTIELMSK